MNWQLHSFYGELDLCLLLITYFVIYIFAEIYFWGRYTWYGIRLLIKDFFVYKQSDCKGELMDPNPTSFSKSPGSEVGWILLIN